MLVHYHEKKFNYDNAFIEQIFVKATLVIKNEHLIDDRISDKILHEYDNKYTSLDVRNTNIIELQSIDHITEIIACHSTKLAKLGCFNKCVLAEFGGCTSLRTLDLNKNFPKLEYVTLTGTNATCININNRETGKELHIIDRNGELAVVIWVLRNLIYKWY
jgi:hypothetical protein